jgi:hypothetical protein
MTLTLDFTQFPASLPSPLPNYRGRARERAVERQALVSWTSSTAKITACMYAIAKDWRSTHTKYSLRREKKSEWATWYTSCLAKSQKLTAWIFSLLSLVLLDSEKRSGI